MKLSLPRVRLGPVSRIALGLVSLATCLLLTADLVFGLLPDQSSTARQVRKRATESLAVQLTALVQTDNFEILRRTLHTVISRDPEVLSIAVRRDDGQVMAETGNHARFWTDPTDHKSTLTHVLVPIEASNGRWGQIEVAWKPAAPQTLKAWLKYPSVALSLVLLTLGLMVFYLYLRRILQRLDPSAAIPDRVRSAFDALSEGVLVIDTQGHVLLANAAFRSLHPDARRELTGRKIDELFWLTKAAGAEPSVWPWARAIHAKRSVTGETIKIEREEGDAVKTVINCAPIADDRNVVRGCLITFDDLSMVEHMNQALLDTVAQLEVAKRKIEMQNTDLKRMADHDQLTGALTRRAFLEQAQQTFLQAAAQRGEICCIMADIDHFKSINDRYGHLAGDQVIQYVSQVLQAGLLDSDLLCRYGGEEFCLLVAGQDAAQVADLADRVRQIIEVKTGPAVIPGEAVRITCSFGIASLEFGGSTLAELIKQADQALYSAKAGGRNRVARYDANATSDPRARVAA